jgi:hypothetical protein
MRKGNVPIKHADEAAFFNDNPWLLLGSPTSPQHQRQLRASQTYDR